MRIKTTPSQRMTETSSWRKQTAAKVAKTKLRPVRGQRKLMSLRRMRSSKQAKNKASKRMPARMQELVAPLLTTRVNWPAWNVSRPPIWAMPFLRQTSPADSKMSPIIRTNSNLAILQVLVANQTDAQFSDLFAHTRTNQRFKLAPKLVERGMGVKLGIAWGKGRQEPADKG